MSTLNTRIVLRNDSSANWLTNSSQVLLKGEVGIEFLEDGKVKMKVGDGTKTWAELEYFGGETTSTTTIEQIDAEKVYFSEDLITTASIGNIELTNGQATIAAKGKNLKEVWDMIFAQEKNPVIKNPVVSITSADMKAYEVGTVVNPSYTAKLDAGNYEFGPATGIVPVAWKISDTAGNIADTASGQFTNIAVTDGTNYKITAEATYADGTIPLTNRGNAYAEGQIKAGSKFSASNAITGYRNTFYGTMTEKKTVDSAVIRALSGKSGKALSEGATFNVDIPVGALRVVIAYPAVLHDITSVMDNNDSMTNIVSAFTESIVSVKGANDALAINYKVYTLDFANPNDVANKYTVTI